MHHHPCSRCSPPRAHIGIQSWDAPPALWRTLSIAALACLLALSQARAGTLQLGRPTVQGGQYVIPVMLSGGEDSVSALNFALSYDPAVFRPVDATAGTAAQVRNKVVTAHAPEDGVFNVVMMGLNQLTVDNGEVARIVLERIGDGVGGTSQLAITNPTLATADGMELPSQGRGLRVDLDDDDKSPGSGHGGTPGEAPVPPNPSETPTPVETPSSDAGTPTLPPAAGVASPQFALPHIQELPKPLTGTASPHAALAEDGGGENQASNETAASPATDNTDATAGNGGAGMAQTEPGTGSLPSIGNTPASAGLRDDPTVETPQMRPERVGEITASDAKRQFAPGRWTAVLAVFLVAGGALLAFRFLLFR